MFDSIKELKTYLSFASVSTDPYYQKGMNGAQDFVANHLKKLDFDVKLVKTPLHPMILGKRRTSPKHPHVLLYAHYDVQPPDPLDLWTTPPFEPRIEGNHIYARGACDNKGPFICQLGGLYSVLKKQPNLPLNITFLIEGEEEMGSPSFPKFLANYKEQLQEADFILVSDSCSPTKDQVVITTSLRGLIDLEVEVNGPSMDLHSGLHGGPIMNPIQALAELCASLHHPDGRVNVPGFYDNVVSPQEWERQELKQYPMNEEAYKRFLGIPEFHSPNGYSPLEAPRFAPTLEFNGIGGGYQGRGSKTIIPAKAFVKITCRLVANQDPEKIRSTVIDTLKERCPKGVHLNIHQRDGGCPYLVVPPNRHNTPKNQVPSLKKAFEAVEKAITETFGKKPLFLREGGSIPIIGQIHKTTGLDSLMIGLALNDDKMHAPNEAFDLDMLKNGITMYKKILSNIAQ